MSVESVEFPSVGIKLVGHLHKPADFDADAAYPAVIMTPPAHQIKDQTPAVYGPMFAARGYVFLAFDYNSKGESDSYAEGFRNDEHNFRKQEDLRNAISYLRSLPFVDHERFYAVGACGGGNVLSGVVITDLRIKAFASVSAMMATDAMLHGDRDSFVAMIKAANDARQRMFETGKAENIDLFGYDDPDYKEKNKEAFQTQLEGFDYYGTARAGSVTYPNFSNRVLANINETVAVNLGEQYADRILQPYLGIVGENSDLTPATEAFYDRVTSEKEMFQVPGASHVDLYDKPEFIEPAVEKMAAFFGKY